MISGPAGQSPLHDSALRGFGSDNHASVHPEILDAIRAADGGHQVAYGDDVYTERLREVVRGLFGDQAEVYPVFNGTGANVVSLQLLTRPWDAVICSEVSHIHVDECGAPEKVAGLKLLTTPTSDGRLTPELIDRHAHGFGDPHHAQPSVVSLTQSTELGTVYSLDELRALAAHAHGLGLSVHMDGARIANAAAALGVGFRELTTDVGVDVLSFGGTKNGLMLGEAVIVLAPQRIQGAEFRRKSSMQLASKMRYVSAQLVALLEGDLWRRNAAHANAMAARLARGVAAINAIDVAYPAEANAVFVRLPRAVVPVLQAQVTFYLWASDPHEPFDIARWMCSWDTTEDDVDAFLTLVTQAVEGADG